MDNTNEIIEWYFWSNLIYCLACIFAITIDSLTIGSCVNEFKKANDAGKKYESGYLEAGILLLWPLLAWGCFYFAAQSIKAKVAPSLISIPSERKDK